MKLPGLTVESDADNDTVPNGVSRGFARNCGGLAVRSKCFNAFDETINGFRGYIESFGSPIGFDVPLHIIPSFGEQLQFCGAIMKSKGFETANKLEVTAADFVMACYDEKHLEMNEISYWFAHLHASVAWLRNESITRFVRA